MTPKAKLVMRASDLGVLKSVPAGTFDTVLYVPADVWSNDRYARAWFKSGGTLQPPERRTPARRKERTISKRLSAAAIRYGRDFIEDQDTVRDDLESAAWDLADALMFSENLNKPEYRWMRAHLADLVYHGMLKGKIK